MATAAPYFVSALGIVVVEGSDVRGLGWTVPKPVTRLAASEARFVLHSFENVWIVAAGKLFRSVGMKLSELRTD